jgi:hypothetical protein
MKGAGTCFAILFLFLNVTFLKLAVLTYEYTKFGVSL